MVDCTYLRYRNQFSGSVTVRSKGVGLLLATLMLSSSAAVSAQSLASDDLEAMADMLSGESASAPAETKDSGASR
jgi:hypothetical protein